MIIKLDWELKETKDLMEESSQVRQIIYYNSLLNSNNNNNLLYLMIEGHQLD